MTRAYSVYLSMFLLLALGLWGILHLGRGLRAPDDVSGAWQVDWNPAAPPGLARACALRIEQSGRYLVLDFDDKLRLPFEVEGGWMTGTDPVELASPTELRAQRASGSLARSAAGGALALVLRTDSVYTAQLSRGPASAGGSH